MKIYEDEDPKLWHEREHHEPMDGRGVLHFQTNPDWSLIHKVVYIVFYFPILESYYLYLFIGVWNLIRIMFDTYCHVSRQNKWHFGVSIFFKGKLHVDKLTAVRYVMPQSSHNTIYLCSLTFNVKTAILGYVVYTIFIDMCRLLYLGYSG